MSEPDVSREEPSQPTDEYVWVRRQWNDYRIARVPLSALWNVEWSDMSGGVHERAPQYFLHGYISCDSIIEGDLGHSCRHGPPPHDIKVCIVKKDNDPATHAALVADAGPKPERRGAAGR